MGFSATCNMPYTTFSREWTACVLASFGSPRSTEALFSTPSGCQLSAMVLAHRVADVTAGISTASGRFNKSTYLRLFDPPMVLDHPAVVSRAGAVRLDAALDARAAFATHSAGRPVPNDEVGVSRTATQQGPTLMAEHTAHPSATRPRWPRPPRVHI